MPRVFFALADDDALLVEERSLTLSSVPAFLPASEECLVSDCSACCDVFEAPSRASSPADAFFSSLQILGPEFSGSEDAGVGFSSHSALLFLPLC